MANSKKPNKQQVNKVRRKADEQDITLGSRSSLPEDEVKSLRKAGSQLDIHHTRKPSQGERQTLSKGRPPKKEKTKTPVDRHRPRKTEVEKEFTHELQKIRNRLRYREKQGFWVKWETLPTRPSRITARDVERLKQYQVQLNDLGEIEVNRVSRDKQARQLRIRKQDLPNYDIRNDPNFVPPMETVQNFDVFDRIEQALLMVISMISVEGINVGHPLNEDRWVAISFGIVKAYEDALETFRQLRDSNLRQQYADYLVAHEPEVMAIININIYPSDEQGVAEFRDELLGYINIH